MDILENVDLRLYSTMRLGGKARYLSDAKNEEGIERLVDWAKQQSVPFMMIGQGSNIVWRDEGYNGLIIVNRIPGKDVISEDDSSLTVRFGAGEVWDDVVAWSVEKNLTGIEFLSLIPGTVGAGPVQNIGAYGAELSNTLLEVEAYDTQTRSFGGMLNEICGFAYRTSRFKTTDKGRFLITGIVVKLKKANPAPPFYDSLSAYLQQHQITEYTPKTIREAVIAIRNSKLPDPKQVANNGSFFTNPMVEPAIYEKLQASYPDLKGWPTKDGRVKLPAGWLVEKAGFKGVHDEQTGMATWQAQALVLVNEHAKTTADLLLFRQKILDKVQVMFGVMLEQEPELLP